MSANKKKGILFGVASGLSWGFYTVLLYNVLNLYAGSTGTVDNFQGWILIITTALVIGLCDSVFGLIFECCYLIKIREFKDYLKILFSKSSFGIIPAALFSGLLGAIPYSIASSYSTSVAGTISAAFPAIGAIVAAIWFKEKLTKLKFFGIILCIVGTGVMYGLSGAGVPIFVYGIAFICAVGYAMEGCFGYNMMRGDVSSTVSTTLRRTFLLLLYLILIIVISTVTNNFGYVFSLVQSFDMNMAIPAFAGLGGVKVAVWIILFIGSCLGGVSYITWYYSMEYSGVATAQVLNITYGIWIVIILMFPPFLEMPGIGTILGALVLFGGAALVSKES